MEKEALLNSMHLVQQASWVYLTTELFNLFLEKMGQSRPLFVYFRSFLVTISLQIEKSIDDVLGIWTRGRRLVGADETMELWRPPLFNHKEEIRSLFFSPCTVFNIGLLHNQTLRHWNPSHSQSDVAQTCTYLFVVSIIHEHIHNCPKPVRDIYVPTYM